MEHILIVDSLTEHGLWVADNLLRPPGYYPLVITDSCQAVTVALTQRPALILLDEEVRPLTGLQFLQRLHQAGLKIPTILMGTQLTEMISLEYLRLGVRDCLIKPLEATELWPVLDRVLHPSRLRENYGRLKQQFLYSQQQNHYYRQQLHTLSSLSKLMPSSPQFWPRLAEAAAYITQAEESLILWRNPTRQVWSVVATWGVDERYFTQPDFDLSDTLAAQVIATGQPLMQTTPALNRADLPYEVQLVLYVPILRDEQVIGVLRVSNRYQTRRFEAYDRRVLMLLAEIIAHHHPQPERGAEHRLAAILQALPEAVVITYGADRQIRFANEAFRVMFKTEPPQVLAEIFPELNWGAVHEITWPDQRTFKVTMTALGPQEQLITFQDLTLLKQVAARYEEFVMEWQRQLALPLEVLRNMARIMKQVDWAEKSPSPRLIQQMGEMMQQFFEMTGELCQGYQAEGTLSDAFDGVDLDKIILGIVSHYQEEAEQQHKQLVYYRSKIGVQVRGDALQLTETMHLLVKNALARAVDRVAVLMEVQAEQLMVKIEDNGGLLSWSDQLIIFDKFVKIQTEGHGVNLALCKAVIQHHQGQIWVESHPHFGTIFTFTLPCVTGQVEDYSGYP